MLNWLTRLLSVPEVDASLRLRLLTASFLATSMYVLTVWYRTDDLLAVEPGALPQAIPAWPLEPLGSLLFLNRFWMRAYDYHLLMLATLALFWLFWVRGTRLPLLVLACLWLNEVVFTLNDWRLASNDHIVALFLTLVFLLGRPRVKCMRLALGAVFWLLALGQLSPSWLQGDLWNSMPGGLPLLPDDASVVRMVCQISVFVEVVVPLLWLVPSERTRQAAAAVLGLFQVYWGMVWGMGMALAILPALVLAWWPDEGSPAGAVRPVGWVLVGGALLARLLGVWAGLDFLDANRRVHADIIIARNSHQYRIAIDCSRYAPLLRTRARVSVSVDGGAPEDHSDRRSPAIQDVDGQALFNPRVVTSVVNPRLLGDPYFYYVLGRQLYRTHASDVVSIQAQVQLDGQDAWHPIVDLSPGVRAARPPMEGAFHGRASRPHPGDGYEAVAGGRPGERGGG